MNHFTIASSEAAFRQLFKLLRDNFSFSDSGGDNFGPFSASYEIAFHLEKGTIKLNNDGTIEVEALDIVWDTLRVEVCFDLPGIHIPGFCIIPDPWNGCLVGVPSINIGGPICIPLDMSGLVSEISEIRARLNAIYFIDPGRLTSWSDLEAEINGKPNMWQIFIDPEFVSVDPIDVPHTIGNIFENLVEDAIRDMLPGGLFGWVVDLVFELLGPIIDLITSALDIVDTIEDFIQDLLGDLFGFLTLIETVVADHFAKKYPILKFEDPYPILTDGSLIPVKIPLRDLKVNVNTNEMIITGDVG